MGCSAVMVVVSSDSNFLVGFSGCGESEALCCFWHLCRTDD